jgi:hypothetical protein
MLTSTTLVAAHFKISRNTLSEDQASRYPDRAPRRRYLVPGGGVLSMSKLALSLRQLID